MKEPKEYLLTEGKIGSALIRFALPFLMASFLQALYGAVDLFVVGRYDSSAAVSAVAIGSQLMQTITGIVLGICMGGTVLIGHAMGEHNDKKAAKGVGNLTILLLLLAVIVTPIMLCLSGVLTKVMETPQEAFADAKQYIFICSCGIPFIIGYNAISSIFRGIGDSKTPMYFVGIACAINVALDFILVGWVGLGASGAAYATIAAQAGSFLLSLVYICKKGFPFEFHPSDIKPDGATLRYILMVGSPLALQDGLVNVSFLVITAIINTMGVVASASVGVVEKLIMFAMLPPSSCASAVATMTAQNLGAGKPDRATKSLKCGILVSLIFGVAICGYSQFLPQTLTGIFSNDSEVIRTAANYLRSYSIDCILVCFVFCMNAYYSGYGKSIISFVHSMIATFGVRIPMSYLISRQSGTTLYQMGFAAPLASTVSIIICFAYLGYLRRNSKI